MITRESADSNPRFVGLQRLGLIPSSFRTGVGDLLATTRWVARVMSRAIALMTAEEAEGTLAEARVAAVSKSSLHRVPRAVAARYE